MTQMNATDLKRFEAMQKDLEGIPEVSSASSTPPNIRPLSGQRYRASTRPLGRVQAGKYLAHGQRVMAEILEPMLRKLQRLLEVAEGHGDDSRWAEFRRICTSNTEMIEKKIKTTREQWAPYW